MAQAERLAKLKDDRLLSHNVLVAGGTILAGVIGFAFQSVFTHRLAPPDYAAVFAALSLLTLITLPASAVTLLMARETSRARASGHPVASAALLRSGNRTLLVVGVVAGILLTLASPVLGTFLGVSTLLAVAVALSMPATFALPLLLGELQGQQRFLAFSSLSVGGAAAKLVAAVVLGLVLGPLGVVLGVTLATLLTYAVAFLLVRQKMNIRVTAPWFTSAIRYLALIVPSTLALSILLSADVLLVKHFFSNQLAGEYSAVAALGRGVFWGAAGVAAVLFPKVTFRESQGGSGSWIVGASVALVLGGGLLSLLMGAALARPVLSAFAGSSYSSGASILPLYTAAMTLLGCASVLIATHQSRARGAFLSVLIPITAAEPLLIVAFHHSLMQVVWVVTLSMVALVVGLAGLLFQRAIGHGSDRRVAAGLSVDVQA